MNVYSFLPAGNYGQKEFMQEYMKKPSSFYFNVVWNKLYRRSLLMNAGLWFTREVYNEDQLFNVRYFRLAKAYTALADPGYYYIQNPQSLLHTNADLSKVVNSRLQMFPITSRCCPNWGSPVAISCGCTTPSLPSRSVSCPQALSRPC